MAAPIDFVSYCVRTHNVTMLNCLQPALNRKLLDDDSIKQGYADWMARYPQEKVPHFFKRFIDHKSTQSELELSEVFSPITLVNAFSRATSNTSVQVFSIMASIDNAMQQAGILRKYIIAPVEIPPEQPDLLTALPLHFLSGDCIKENILLECICPTLLKQYFVSLIETCFNTKGVYMRPEPEHEREWFGFGVLLAHVGSMGCHFDWEVEFDPLIWGCLRCENWIPDSDDEIEQYLLELSPELIGSRRYASLIGFQVGKEDCTEDYFAELRTEWNEHLNAMRSVYREIHRGFWADLTFDFAANMFEAMGLFQSFRQTIGKMPLPAIRLWYEGFRARSSPGTTFEFQVDWEGVFAANVSFQFRIPEAENEVLWEERFKLFIQNFLVWTKRTHSARQFIVALSGVAAVIPIRKFGIRIIIVGEEEGWHSGLSARWMPRCILPARKGLLYAIENVNSVFTEISRIFMASGRAEYEIFKPESTEFLEFYSRKVRVNWRG
jgi:hypothetical protein